MGYGEHGVHRVGVREADTPGASRRCGGTVPQAEGSVSSASRVAPALAFRVQAEEAQINDCLSICPIQIGPRASESDVLRLSCFRNLMLSGRNSGRSRDVAEGGTGASRLLLC